MMDFNCFAGNWPFFRVRCNTVEKLMQLHNRCGITGGVVSSLEAIFYQDPYEAELQLAQQLEGTPYLQAMVLNPMLPAWKDDLRRCVEKLRIKAVRLVPGFHGYALTDPIMDQVCDALRGYGLPLILTLRLRDDRTMWMLQPRHLAIDEIAAFLDRHRDIPTLLAHIYTKELKKLDAQFAGRDNLFADLSGFKDHMLPLHFIRQETAAWERIVFGSGAPLMEPLASKMTVDYADLDKKDNSRQVLDNSRKVFALFFSHNVVK